MRRRIQIAAAQMGPNQETDSRAQILARMLALLDQAVDAGVEVLVYPELALTTYFPKRIRDDYEQFFDTEMPNMSVEPLFRRAREAGIAFHVGYAERTPQGRYYNTAIYVDERGDVLHRYRKMHLPGLPSPAPDGLVRVYEPHYFAHGDTGFTTFRTRQATMGISICQDRRYPESYRSLGLRGAQIVLTGYNTPASPLALDQNELSLRAGAYENNLFVVGVAKAGVEDGVHLIGESCIVDPHGQVLARASTEDDELISARIDLDQVDEARRRWNFYGRRHPEQYGVLVERVSVPETKSRHS
jgi:predicted amidohydrolase